MDAGLKIGGVAAGNLTTGAYRSNADCGCCEDGPPPTEGCFCPESTQCRQINVCVTEFSVTETIVRVWTQTRTASPSDPTCPEPSGQTFTQTETTTRTWRLIGGPHLIPPTCPTCCDATGLVPVQYIRTLEHGGQTCNPNAVRIDEREEATLCQPIQGLCYIPPVTGNTPILYNDGISPNPVGTTHSEGAEVFCQTPGGQNVSLGRPTVDTTTTRAWTFGHGLNTYVEDSATVRFTPRAGASDGSGGICVGPVTETQTNSARITFTVHFVQECDGDPIVPPCASEPTICTPSPQTYIIATPCGTTLGVPPDVYVPSTNVTECGTFQFGSFCYTVSPTGPRVTLPQAPPNTFFGVIDAESPFAGKTCCECQAECPKIVLAPRPCWLNGRRINGQFYNSRDNPELVSPPLINGTCCCRDDDIISLVEASSDIIFPLQPDPNDPIHPYEEHWRLCPVPLSFRRDATDPVGNAVCPTLPVNNPGGFPGTLFSSRTDRQGVLIGQQAWPNLSPYEGCEWERMGNQIDFFNPQNSIGFYNNALGTLLPCPNDTGGESGGWRITIWNISVTCRTFALDATFENVDGNGEVFAVLRNRLQVNIERSPEATGQPCTGGCPSGTGGGGSVTLRGLKSLGTGCSSCGKDGL